MGQPYPPPPGRRPPFVPPGPGGHAPPARDGVATAGFVTALVGAVLSVVPIIGLVGWVLCPVGLVFSIVGLVRASRRGTGKKLPIAGIVLGALGLVICILWAAVFGAAVDSLPPPEPPASVNRAGGPVTLEVTGEASVLSIRHTTASGAETGADERLPFRVTIPVPPTGPVTVAATGVLGKSGSTGRMTCTITQDGLPVVTRTGSEVLTCSAQ